MENLLSETIAHYKSMNVYCRLKRLYELPKISVKVSMTWNSI